MVDFDWEKYITLQTLSEDSRSKVELVRQGDSGSLFIKKTLYASDTPYRLLQYHRIPGIPHIFALDRQEGKTVLLEEYVKGETLHQRLESYGTVDDCTAAKWLLQLCFILQGVHRLHIIHRDIKPSNILITPEQKLYLIDFDASRVYEPGKSTDTVCLGTKGYAAPEQYGYAQTDARTDLYSMGVLFNQLLTGKFPEEQIYTGKLGQIIQGCIPMDPNQRFQSVEQVIQLWRLQYPDMFSPPVASRPTSLSYQPPVTPSKNRFLSAILCGLLVGLLAWLDFQHSYFSSFRDQLITFVQHLFLLLPPVGFASDLFHLRTRPILPYFRKRPHKWVYAFLFFLLWFITLLVVCSVCFLLFTPEAQQYLKTL